MSSKAEAVEKLQKLLRLGPAVVKETLGILNKTLGVSLTEQDLRDGVQVMNREWYIAMLLDDPQVHVLFTNTEGESAANEYARTWFVQNNPDVPHDPNFWLINLGKTLYQVPLPPDKTNTPASYGCKVFSGPANFTKGNVACAGVDQNRKIHAIKAVRKITSLGLREAKDFVDEVQKCQSGDYGSSPIPYRPRVSLTSMDAYRVLTDAGFTLEQDPGVLLPDKTTTITFRRSKSPNRIQVIKRVREATYLDLKEAKELVDYISNTHQYGFKPQLTHQLMNKYPLPVFDREGVEYDLEHHTL